MLKTLFHIKWKSQPRNLPFYISGIALLSTFLYFSQVRSEIIATYALCGFANLSSIGIQLGALGPMAPSRRGDLAQIVLRALLGGIVTSLMTACIAGKNLSLSISFPISLNKIFPDCCVSVQELCIMIHPWTRIWLFRPYMSCQCISMVTPESSFSFIKALYPVLKYWKLNKFFMYLKTWKASTLKSLQVIRFSIVSLKYGLLYRSSCCWTHYTTCLSQLHCCQYHNGSSGNQLDFYSDLCFAFHRADNSLRMIVNE